MYEFKLVSPEEAQWESIARSPDHHPYKSKEWVKHLAETYGAEPFVLEVYQDKLIGYFVGERIQRIMNIIAAPFEGWQTPYQGLSIFHQIPNQERIEIYKALIEWIFRHGKGSMFQVTDWHLDLPHVAHSGLKYEIVAGYFLDISGDLEIIQSNMHATVRRYIRRAAKRGIRIRTPRDIEAFISTYYDQLRDVFKRHHLKPTHSFREIHDSIKSMNDCGKLLALEAVSDEDESLASVLFVHENDIAFLLGFGSYWKYQLMRATEPLMFEAIRILRERGVKTLEFGGKGRYKQKYGPNPYVRPRIVAAKHSSLLTAKHVAKGIFFGFRNGVARLTRRFSIKKGLRQTDEEDSGKDQSIAA